VPGSVAEASIGADNSTAPTNVENAVDFIIPPSFFILVVPFSAAISAAHFSCNPQQLTL
jgi:hypothetical protein